MMQKIHRARKYPDRYFHVSNIIKNRGIHQVHGIW